MLVYELYYQSWCIETDDAVKLHTAIQHDSKRDDLLYCVIGDESPSSNGGHNCFTWTREKINAMQAPDVHIKTKYLDFFIANPRSYLSGGEPTSKSCLVM